MLSGDPATTRHIVDSYLKHETLAADSHFKNYTRWQPRPAQGQVYISPALMESYKSWAEKPSTRVSDADQGILDALERCGPTNHLLAFKRGTWTITRAAPAEEPGPDGRRGNLGRNESAADAVKMRGSDYRCDVHDCQCSRAV